MRRLFAKGLHALLTNPISGEPIDLCDRLSLFGNLCLALYVIIVLIGGTLGLGNGR